MDELRRVFAGPDIYGAVESWVGVRRLGGYFGLGTIRAVAEAVAGAREWSCESRHN